MTILTLEPSDLLRLYLFRTGSPLRKIAFAREFVRTAYPA